MMGKCESVRDSNVNNQHTHTFFEMKNPNTTTGQISPTHIRMQIYLIPIFILVHCLSHSLGVLHSQVCAAGDVFLFFIFRRCIAWPETIDIIIYFDSAMPLTSVDNCLKLDGERVGFCFDWNIIILSEFCVRHHTRHRTAFRRWCGFVFNMNKNQKWTPVYWTH